jgi:hypothetical protein
MLSNRPSGLPASKGFQEEVLAVFPYREITSVVSTLGVARVGCCITARSGEHILCGNQNNTLTTKISHGHGFARVSGMLASNRRFYFTSILGRVSFELDPENETVG